MQNIKFSKLAITTMATKNKKWLLIGGALLLLIFTNPSMQDFKDYKGAKTDKENFYNLKKSSDFLIFSTYDDGFTRHYIGIFNNFFSIGNSKQD